MLGLVTVDTSPYNKQVALTLLEPGWFLLAAIFQKTRSADGVVVSDVYGKGGLISSFQRIRILPTVFISNTSCTSNLTFCGTFQTKAYAYMLFNYPRPYSAEYFTACDGGYTTEHLT